MWALINAPDNLIFGVALMVMLLLGVLELISLLLGGINDWINGLLPDSLTETTHAEVGLDATDAGIFIRFLSWLYIGKIPLLMLIVVFLAVFGLLGYGVQTMAALLFGSYLHGALAAVITWLLALPLVRLVAAGLYRILPRDETTAIQQENLVGRVGIIVLGDAKIGSPAQVRVKDAYGNWGRCLTEIPQPNYTQALQALTPPAQAGLSGAQFSLGNLYLRGQGVPANAAVGLYWVGLAAAQGEKNALEQMGHCLIARECSQQYYQPALGYAVIILAYQRAQPSNPLQKFTHYWRQKHLYSQLSDSNQQHAQNYIQQWQNLTPQALVEQIWLESGAVHKQP